MALTFFRSRGTRHKLQQRFRKHRAYPIFGPLELPVRIGREQWEKNISHPNIEQTIIEMLVLEHCFTDTRRFSSRMQNILQRWSIIWFKQPVKFGEKVLNAGKFDC